MCNAAWRYFVSATNWADIKEDMKKLIAIAGSKIIHEQLACEAIENGIIKKPQMRIVYTNNTDKSRQYLKGEDLIKLGIVGNTERNNQICSIALEQYHMEGKRIMICVWEDAHAMILQETLRKMGVEAHMYFSKLDKKEKTRVDNIVSNSTEPFISICTIALGISADTRAVDTIMLADVRKSSIQLLQRIGRGHRILDDVTDLLIYDFKDGFNDTTYKWHRERQKTFNDYYFKNESFTKKRAASFGIKLETVPD
jgi:superfamily II DNA or RNA helicase